MLDIITNVVHKCWPKHGEENALEDHRKDAQDDEKKAVKPEGRATEDLRRYSNILENGSEDWDVVGGLNGEEDGDEKVGNDAEENKEMGYGRPQKGVQGNLQEEVVG